MKLSQQAFLLIAFPLAFELGCVGWLVENLRELEEEYKKEASARSILMSINNELRYTIEATSDFGIYQINKDPQYLAKFHSTMENIQTERRKLDLASYGAAPKELLDFNKTLDEAMQTMSSAEKLISSGDRIDMMRSVLKIQKILKEIGYDSREVLERQTELHEVRMVEQARARQGIENFVIFMVFASILLATALAMYFRQVTAKRFDVLMRNNLHLAIGKPLQKPLSGSDEIATLDKTFHAMAENLIEAQHKEQALTENAAEIICSLDKNGKLTKLNQAVTNLWLFDRDDLLGRSIFTLLTPATNDRARASFAEAIEHNTKLEAEIEVKKKDGSVCDMLWSMQWSGKEESMFCVLHDITERKRVERLKQEVMAMVSHDLRAPLTSLNLVFDLFELGNLGQLNERGEQKVQQSRNLIERLVAMINDLLDIEKLESGMFVLDYGEENIKELFGKAVESIRDKAAAKNVKIEVAVHDVAIQCDGQRMIRVMINLVDNAIKFAPVGTIIRVSSELLQPNILQINITDQGKGVPPDKVEMIFERFKQSDSTGEIEKKGTGLGLSICKAIVEAHGGTIGVSSEVGKGSTFWFRIPNSKPAAAKT